LRRKKKKSILRVKKGLCRGGTDHRSRRVGSRRWKVKWRKEEKGSGESGDNNNKRGERIESKKKNLPWVLKDTGKEYQ